MEALNDNDICPGNCEIADEISGEFVVNKEGQARSDRLIGSVGWNDRIENTS